MKKYLLLIVFGLLSVAFFSCKEIQPVTIGGVNNVKVISLTQQGIELDFDMNIDNPNSMAVSVFPSKFHASMNGISIGDVRLDKRTKIKAQGEHVATFHVKSDFSKIGLTEMAGMLPLLTSKNAALSLNGNVRVGKWFYKRKFPIELKKSIPLSK